MSGRTLLNGRYELDPLPVPGGAMGQVWFGRDTTLDREIAVKFIRFADDRRDDELVRRFRRESGITARLEHPGVPAVYDCGEENGRPFLIMQRMRGINLADLLAEQGGPLPIGWAAAIAAQICSVLCAAHEAKLVPRDLKPANLMLEPNGAVKVLDFGLAVAPTLSDFSKITQTGSPGTPASAFTRWANCTRALPVGATNRTPPALTDSVSCNTFSRRPTSTRWPSSARRSTPTRPVG